jgi:polyphosphate kinase 2 (PPK2 family)
MYIQRYLAHFPAAGEIVIFDRSWYNRAGVEYVMGFCSKQEHRRFLELCPQIEQYIIDAGIILIKFWLEVGDEEQKRRFAARIDDPVRQWKLSPTDLASLTKWDDYTEAKEAMFFYTDTADAPWTVIKSNDKKRARTSALQQVLHQLDYPGKDPSVARAPDPEIVGPAWKVYESGEQPGRLFPRL